MATNDTSAGTPVVGDHHRRQRRPELCDDRDQRDHGCRTGDFGLRHRGIRRCPVGAAGMRPQASNSRRPGNLGIAIPPLARGRKLCRRRHWVPILELLLGCTQVLAVFTIWVGAIRRIGFRLTRGRSGLRRHRIFPCEGLKSRDTDALWGG